MGKGFLARLSPQLAADLIGSAPLVHYPAGSVSASAHDTAWAAVVVSGLVRQYLPARDGRQVTIKYAQAGDLVGSFSADRLWPRAEVEAIEPSDLLYLDVVNLQRTARADPELSMALVQQLEESLRKAHQSLASTAFSTVRSRVARDLLERAGKTEPPRSGARMRVTQQALANATGSVREVVGRALRDLRLEGIIETDRSGVTILDVEALTAEAESTP
jgi:CRP/FNR family transcriptional regulator